MWLFLAEGRSVPAFVFAVFSGSSSKSIIMIDDQIMIQLMDYLEKLSELPTISLKQLQNTFKSSRKRKKILTKIKCGQSDVNVIQPYFYSKRYRLPYILHQKCKACLQQPLTTRQKHSFLKKCQNKSYTHEDRKSIPNRKTFQVRKNKPEEKENLRINREDLEEYIERKIIHGIKILQKQKKNIFRKKVNRNLEEKSTKEDIQKYYLKKFDGVRNFDQIAFKISELVHDKQFIKEYGKTIAEKKKKNTHKSNKQKGEVVVTLSLAEKICETIEKGDKNYQNISKFANTKLDHFKQCSKELSKLLKQKQKQQKIKENMTEAMQMVRKMIQGKNDYNERQRLIEETKDSVIKNMNQFGVAEKKNNKASRKSILCSKKMFNEIQIDSTPPRRKSQFSQTLKEAGSIIEGNTESENSYSKQDSESSCNSQKRFKAQSKNHVKTSINSQSQKKIYLQKRTFDFNEHSNQQDQLQEEKKQQKESSKKQINYHTLSKTVKQTVFKAEKRKRRETILENKKKARIFINQHKDTIQKVEKEMKNLSFNQYIINNKIDSVLTKKKKIRMLREMIRKAFEKEEVSSNVFNQIVDYLDIYENNCRLLLGKKDNNYDEPINFAEDLNLKDQCLNLGLKFIDLNHQYNYGQADEDGYNIYGSKVESPVKEKPKLFFNIPLSEQISEDEDGNQVRKQSDLVQIGLKDTSTVEYIERRASTQRGPILKEKGKKKFDLERIRQLSKKSHVRQLISKKMADMSLLLTQWKNKN